MATIVKDEFSTESIVIKMEPRDVKQEEIIIEMPETNEIKKQDEIIIFDNEDDQLEAAEEIIITSKEADNVENLLKIISHVKTELDIALMTELNDKIISINNFCKGDGCGLTGGMLIDMFLTRFLVKHLPTFQECHDSEADCSICDEKLSLKKINGKSTIALNWSKNPTVDKKEKFMHNIMIINLTTSQWWKKKPVQCVADKIDFTKTIPAGIFIIDKYFCKQNIVLSSNNKTNSLITQQYLYMMLHESMAREMFIPLPKKSKKYTFDILSAFQ